MSRLPLRGRALVLAALGAATAGLALTYPTAGAGASTPPTNAAKVFRWGNAVWHDEFVNPDSHEINTSMWSANQPSLVDEQNGMLTMSALAQPVAGNIKTTVIGHGETYGRWEARIRSEQKGSTGTPYRVVMRLVPVGDQTCGANDLVMASYTLGTSRAHMSIRSGANEFNAGKDLTGLSDDSAFHTYAVEVTTDHISWFVDTHVLMTERRPAALTGLKYKVQFALMAPAGATTMAPSRMQMDWVRYYNLKRPDAKSIDAPEATEAPNAVSCTS